MCNHDEFVKIVEEVRLEDMRRRLFDNGDLKLECELCPVIKHLEELLPDSLGG